MATWTTEELDRIGGADELQLTSFRDDGAFTVDQDIERATVEDLHVG